MIARSQLSDRGRAALDGAASALGAQLGAPVTLDLLDDVEAVPYDELLALEREVFAIEDNDYSEDDLRECLGGRDAVLLVARRDGELIAYGFGFREPLPGARVNVPGTEYYLDTAVVGLAWQQRGIGTLLMPVALRVVADLGYRRVGMCTEETDKTGRPLLAWYLRAGFEPVGPVTPGEEVCLRLELTEARIDALLAATLGDGPWRG